MRPFGDHYMFLLCSSQAFATDGFRATEMAGAQCETPGPQAQELGDARVFEEPHCRGELCPELGYEFQMAAKASDDPILKRFRAAVNEIYGGRVARVMLFGSRARGDARPDSDYDIAVFLREMPDRFVELHRLADVSTAILYDTGEVVNALPYRAETYNDPRMPLMHEIRREGVDL